MAGVPPTAGWQRALAQQVAGAAWTPMAESAALGWLALQLPASRPEPLPLQRATMDVASLCPKLLMEIAGRGGQAFN